MKTYSNPRTEAVIENWPSGSKRVQAIFTIENDPKRGQRATRTTTGATKKLTYASKMRIVDGDDGRNLYRSPDCLRVHKYPPERYEVQRGKRLPKRRSLSCTSRLVQLIQTPPAQYRGSYTGVNYDNDREGCESTNQTN